MCREHIVFLYFSLILFTLLSCSGSGESGGDGGVDQKAGFGDFCSADEECGSKICYLGDIFLKADRGYCTKGCLDMSDCENTNVDETYCCVERNGSSPFCQRIQMGEICGDQDSACGTDCSGNLDSECRSEELCYKGTEATYCTKECRTDEDCATCYNPEVAPGATLLCEPTGEEKYHCLIIF